MRPDPFDPPRREAKYAPRKMREHAGHEPDLGEPDPRWRGHGNPQRRDHARQDEAMRQIREFTARY